MMIKQPVVIMPFIIIAFLECLALEAAYFAGRSPISIITGPIIRKFFGEQFLHYPGCLILFPKLFYYFQILIYVFAGIFLSAICVNIFKNTRDRLPVRTNAMVKNAAKAYISFSGCGVIIVVLMLLLKKADIFVFTEFVKILSKIGMQISAQSYYAGLTLVIFISNIVLQAFVLLTIPIMVIGKKSMLKAFSESVILCFRNFTTVFTLIFLPFFAYLPLTLLKSFSTEIAEKTFPEINLYLIFIDVIAVIFLDCFVVICASRFLIDKCKVLEKDV